MSTPPWRPIERFPDHFFDDLPVAAQTAFANLQTAAKARELSRSVADISGSFNRKKVKSSTYWYYQTKDPDGNMRQVYLGKEGPEILSLIENRDNPSRVESAAHLARLSASAVALGAPSITPKHGRVIRKIAEHGFFRAGGVLAGTHAFLAYQNHLGVQWGDAYLTMDLDFAHPGKNVTVAFPNLIKVDVRTALESLKMGFLPVHGQARFRKEDEPDFDVDFLTTMTRKGDAPIQNDRLGVMLQPLKFMELAFEQSFQTVLLLNDGPLVVTVPRPEFFALHKIIVSVERKTIDPTKARKDAIQSAALMTFFLDRNPLPLLDAYVDVISRGRGWRQRVAEGIAAIDKQAPDLKLQDRIDTAMAELQRDEDDTSDQGSAPKPG